MASYDPHQGVAGLATLLEELIPACSKINLDYFFARTDIEHFGVRDPKHFAGELRFDDGDLHSGLPWCAVKDHEPVRLIAIVADTFERVQRALKVSRESRNLVDNDWVFLAAYQGNELSRVTSYGHSCSD